MSEKFLSFQVELVNAGVKDIDVDIYWKGRLAVVLNVILTAINVSRQRGG